MLDQREPIRGKVAQILNAREVALNIGSDHGVEIGMYFDVLNPKGEEIKDPETHEVLASLQLPKKHLKIVRVEAKVSVARTYKTWQKTRGGAFSLTDWETLFAPFRTETKYDTLKERESTFEELDEEDSIVKIGDPVVQVFPEEKEAG